MDINQAEEQIKALREQIWESNRLYYIENAPTLSDYEYDSLCRRLAELEAQFPMLDSPDSPSHRVSSDLSAGFRKVRHRYPMLSLGNTYNITEIEEFAARAAKAISTPFTYCCELKFDGTAICLWYKKGKLVRALTRGDGVEGDDVTANALKIASIPHVLSGSGYPDDFEIRGEVLMPYDSFDRLNQERIAQEEEPFSNPRNAASGSLKLLDSDEVARRGLICTLYHIPEGNVDFKTHEQTLAAASSWGLPISEHRKICRNIDEIEEYIDYWDSERKSLPFPTDGIVIKINEMECRADLGYTSKSPRWAVAYKYKAEQALTPVLSIDYQVGRTGAVTPVANLEPVFISGTMVKRATLNNADQIALMDIRVGDWVYVEKGGEIIPKITSVELSKRPLTAVPVVFPKLCPDCGTPLVKAEDEARWYCPAGSLCPTQVKGKLLHFVSRKAMNILCGESTIEQLYSKNLVKTPSDFYSLEKEQLLTLEGWKDASADRFLASLSKSKSAKFPNVLFALGIRHIGETTARDLARHFVTVDALGSASKEELLQVPDVGEVIAISLLEWFSKPSNILELEALRSAGLNFAMDEPVEASSGALKGMSIVISGVFSISRDEMKALIERNGGKNSSSLSKKTSYLLAGANPGPEKLKKAEALGLEVIDENRFKEIIGI